MMLLDIVDNVYVVDSVDVVYVVDIVDVVYVVNVVDIVDIVVDVVNLPGLHLNSYASHFAAGSSGFKAVVPSNTTCVKKGKNRCT